MKTIQVKGGSRKSVKYVVQTSTKNKVPVVQSARKVFKEKFQKAYQVNVPYMLRALASMGFTLLEIGPDDKEGTDYILEE